MQTYTPSGGLSPASGLFASLLPAIAPKSFRAALGDQIERMIEMLDQLDGDPDLEPDLAGSPNLGAACDAEGDDSDLELSGDEREPSLGSLGGTATVLWYAKPPAWAGGSVTDRELDDCDLEDGHDAEDDPAERGIGDQDGLEEQAGLFDRSGEEPERVSRPWDYEARRARRELLGDVDRQARALAVRLSSTDVVLDNGWWRIVR